MTLLSLRLLSCLRNHPISGFVDFHHFDQRLQIPALCLFSLSCIYVKMLLSSPSSIRFRHLDSKLIPFQGFSGPFWFDIFILFIRFAMLLITYFRAFIDLFRHGHTSLLSRWFPLCPLCPLCLLSVCFASPCLFNSRCGQKEGRDVTWRLKGCLPANRELQSEKVKGCQGWSAAVNVQRNGSVHAKVEFIGPLGLSMIFRIFDCNHSRRADSSALSASFYDLAPVLPLYHDET